MPAAQFVPFFVIGVLDAVFEILLSSEESLVALLKLSIPSFVTGVGIDDAPPSSTTFGRRDEEEKHPENEKNKWFKTAECKPFPGLEHHRKINCDILSLHALKRLSEMR